MADDLWRKERTRLYLLSYKELLYLLKKYPKSSPHKLTKDVSTQTSPNLFKTTHNKTINNTNDTCISISPTIQLSPSPHSKRKGQYNCNPSIKTMHKSAIKVSDSLFNNLINNNTSNDSENDTQLQNNNNNKINRKRSYNQSIQSDTNINDTNTNNRPLKRRKISKNKNKNKNKTESNNKNNIIKKITKPKLFRCNNNNISILSTKCNANNSYESIESASPVQYSQFKPKTLKTKKPKKSKSKISIIPTKISMNESINKMETFEKHRNKKKIRRRRSSLALQETSDGNIRNNKLDLNDNIFGMLPAFEQQNIKQSKELIDCEEKEMSNELYDTNEKRWQLNNESIPENTINISPIKSSNCESQSQSHSQIIEKYSKNVSCFGGNVNGNMNIGSEVTEDNSESKASLFDNTNFSDEQMNVNSLLNDNESIENKVNNVNNNYNGTNKYSVFKFPND